MNTKISVWAAILTALTFLIYSIVQLVGYGLSTGAINADSAGNLSSLIQFLSLNFKTLVSILIISLILTTSLVYISFIILTKKVSSKLLKISSYTILITNLVIWILILSVYISPLIYSSINIPANKAEAFLGIAEMFFGIALIKFKKQKSPLLFSLGILFILQGLTLFTSPFLPIRIVDFTIALNVLEAVFFSKLIR